MAEMVLNGAEQCQQFILNALDNAPRQRLGVAPHNGYVDAILNVQKAYQENHQEALKRNPNAEPVITKEMIEKVTPVASNGVKVNGNDIRIFLLKEVENVLEQPSKSVQNTSLVANETHTALSASH